MGVETSSLAADSTPKPFQSGHTRAALDFRSVSASLLNMRAGNPKTDSKEEE